MRTCSLFVALAVFIACHKESRPPPIGDDGFGRITPETMKEFGALCGVLNEIPVHRYRYSSVLDDTLKQVRRTRDDGDVTGCERDYDKGLPIVQCDSLSYIVVDKHTSRLLLFVAEVPVAATKRVVDLVRPMLDSRQQAGLDQLLARPFQKHREEVPSWEGDTTFITWDDTQDDGACVVLSLIPRDFIPFP